MTEAEMKIKDWLNRAYIANNNINALICEQNTLRRRLEGGGISYENIGAGRSDSYQNSREAQLCKLAELSKEIDGEIDSFVDILKEIKTGLKDKLPPDLYAIASYRFLSFLKIKEIAEETNYSEKQVARKLREILRKMSVNVLECPANNLI